jgi:hypothetical protein
MKIIMTGRGGHDNLFFGTSQVERLLNWLGGVDTHALSIPEKLLSQHLSQGITIQHATAEQLGQATKAAMETNSQHSEAIVKFVFSRLRGHDGAKCEAVIRSMISVLPTETVPKFIRIAVRARPSLALTVSKAAAMLVPEEKDQIASAVESVVTTAF